jgi:hypothetical protein
MIQENLQPMINECLNSHEVLEELFSYEEFLKIDAEKNCKILVLNFLKAICPRCDQQELVAI